MQGTQEYKLEERDDCAGVPCMCEDSKEPKVTNMVIVVVLETPLTATITIIFLNERSHWVFLTRNFGLQEKKIWVVWHNANCGGFLTACNEHRLL